MSFTLVNGLPIVSIRLGVSEAFKSHCDRQMEPYPEDLQVRALIDTGASITVIDDQLVSRLCLRSKGFCKVRGFDNSPDGSASHKEYPNYDVSLSIWKTTTETTLHIPDLQVVAVPLDCTDYDMLLGMDVLRRCTLHFHFSDNFFDIQAAAA